MIREEFDAKIEKSQGREKGSLLLQYCSYLQQIDPKKAILKAKKALELNNEIKNDKFEIYCYIHLGYSYLHDNDLENVLISADKIFAKSDEINLNLGRGAAMLLKGDALYRKNEMHGAIEAYLLSLQHYEGDEHKDKRMSVYNNLAKVHHSLNEMDKAYEYMALSLEIGEELNHPAADTLRMNMASIRYSQQDFKKALELYKETVTSYHAKNLKQNEAFAIYNVGHAYGALKDYDNEEKSYLETYKILKELDNTEELSKINRSLALLYIEKGDFSSAFRFLNEAKLIAENNEQDLELIKTLKAFSLCYEKQGDIEKALQYHKEFAEKEQKFNEKLNRDKIAEIEARHQTEIYRIQNKELKEKNLSLNEQIEKLTSSVHELQKQHQNLQRKFEETALELNQKDDILSQQSRMAVMGKMVSQIAHQWKQPLNLIGIIVQSFQDAYEFEEMTEEFLDKNVLLVMEQIQYMADTINDFRNFFKPESNSLFKLAESLKKAEKLTSFALNKQNIKFESSIDNSLEFYGNPNDIVQVLINIINNASDAMAEAKVNEKLINISCFAKNDSKIIKIFNNGTYLENKTKEKLFEPYFTTKGENGTGIGLYICHSIIENKYHGQIFAQNIDNGVEFTIVLPEILQNN